ncbi:cAMP-regulated phosphoprotein 21-like [Leguminivora glycinivorella]|uniref:cAMP-regulated phosphoprotein 21-like n=1 Tax=Leguminivora glycinivorella TaxID=1035111 RepID=UPI00200BDD94|nr:cAMP-regulated phosphoprotein 21-like [Leguminivora glycinivorella]
MENPESEMSSLPEESSALNRNRSFKSKQLVRSQAIRESQSPPRPASPAIDDTGTDTVTVNTGTGNSGTGNPVTEVEVEEKRRPVEIHITGGAWESGEQKSRRRWPQQSRDLLSNGPRVACVAGCRSQCRGQRRRNPCPTKQDSGISCPDDCTDCSDFEHTGGSSNDVRKACSLDSDESYCRCPEGKVKPPKTNSLSRTDSADNKIEPTGPELVNFIRETLNKNTRDRMLLLKIEKELHALVTDTGRCNFKFPCMTSYERMLVHRVATLFQLTHHLDQNSKNSVTVSKSGTSGGRIPCTSFKQWCTVNFPPSPIRQDSVNAKSILKRDTHSPEDANAASRAVERSKSLEQREKEYERVRRRIFSTDNCSQDESQWPWLQSGPVKLLTPDSGRNKLLKVQSLEGAGPPVSWRARGAVSKSHSFGGYGGGADAAPANQPRLLSRQGDLASSSWRLSPSSSGYKTLSLRSTDSVTPSPTGGASPEPGTESVVFAVADLNCVPPGALVIHPQTGRPLTNPDGSVYHFDPQNPPVIYDTYQDQKIQNCEKRRGRLEKQHSFIDTEAECRCDDGRSKCCCECRRHDGCNQKSDKISVQPEQKTTPIPSSPVKNRYEQNTEQTNQTSTPETATNHRQTYEASATRVAEPTNQRPEIQAQTFEPANQAQYEPQRTEFENQRPYEPKVFENRTFEASNQRPPSFDPLANQRAANENVTNLMTSGNKLTNQESVEMPQYVPQQYHKGFRNDEVTSPPQMVQNPMMADVGVYNIMAQAKITPVPVDPLRPVSLTNMVFPAPVAPAYPTSTKCGWINHCSRCTSRP